MQRGDVVGADEAHMAGQLGRELGKALLGHRVPVDADERSRGPDPLGDQARVTASAERAVDRHLPRARIEQLDQLAREDGDVRVGHVKQCRQGSRQCREHG